MAFKKGNSGNPNGRPLGARNKIAKDVAEMIRQFVSYNLTRLQNDFDALTPSERVKAITSMLNYVVPKQQSINANVDKDETPLDLQINLVSSQDEIKRLEARKELNSKSNMIDV